MQTKHDLSALPDEVVDAADLDPNLVDALKDYEHACERMSDMQAPLGVQALWAAIRIELAAEIRRLYLARR